MKLAVTGAKGRLGSELVKYDCYPIDADVTSPKALQREIDRINPDTIIHCASITAVDGAEGILYKQAQRVNVIGTACLRKAFDGRIIYISTDYVFDGRKGPYSETANPNPISVYGMTKHQGEEIIQKAQHSGDVIVRTTILYGNSDKPDFVKAILSQLEKGEPFMVTTAISGSPTYVPHLVDALLKICGTLTLPRIINVVGKDVLSRYEFAKRIADVFELDGSLIRPTKKISGIAARPLKAGLKIELAEKYGLPIYSVDSGLKEMKNARSAE